MKETCFTQSTTAEQDFFLFILKEVYTHIEWGEGKCEGGGIKSKISKNHYVHRERAQQTTMCVVIICDDIISDALVNLTKEETLLFRGFCAYFFDHFHGMVDTLSSLIQLSRNSSFD